MHSTQIKVRGYHLDGYGHVNNARYLEFLEEGRWDFFESANAVKNFHERGLNFIVVNLNIDYLFFAKAGDVLTVTTKLGAVGKKSQIIEQTISNQNQKPVLKAKVTFVIIDQKTQKPVEIDSTIQDLLPQ